jgi:hypothetical protein
LLSFGRYGFKEKTQKPPGGTNAPWRLTKGNFETLIFMATLPRVRSYVPWLTGYRWNSLQLILDPLGILSIEN